MAAQNILYGIGIGLFLCAAAVAIGVIAAMIVPNRHRILGLLRDGVDPAPARTLRRAPGRSR